MDLRIVWISVLVVFGMAARKNGSQGMVISGRTQKKK